MQQLELLLLTALLCHAFHPGCQLQQQQQQELISAEQYLEEQPVESLLFSSDFRLSKLVDRVPQAKRQRLMRLLFNRSQRTLQTGVDLCWAFAGVSCVCAHLHLKPTGSVRDFACASVLNASECAASGGSPGCTRCPAEFAGVACAPPACVSTCQCRCSPTWPSAVRPCAAWCDASDQCPSGGSRACRPKVIAGLSSGGADGDDGSDRVDGSALTPGISAGRVWNGLVVCLFLLACLFMAAYGCRLCALCSRLYLGARHSLAALRSRASHCFCLDGSSADDENESVAGFEESGFERPRSRRRSRRYRDRVGSFLSLSCAESINVVSPTDLILPSYREQASASATFPPTYEQALEALPQWRGGSDSPPPPYSEPFHPQGNG